MRYVDGNSANPTPPYTNWTSAAHVIQEAIPRSQIGLRAGADYRGDGLAVVPTPEGARLRCVFQRLEGDATREGLWLTSTVPNGENDRFRVRSASVGRSVNADASNPLAPFMPMNFAGPPGLGVRQSSGALEASAASPERQGTAALQDAIALPPTGTVQVADKVVRFLRPGVIEEYSVSMDGVRQDFVVRERPAGTAELAVRLAVSGAKVEPSAFGALLVLEDSGRKIAYSRLRVTDATGRELSARIEVVGDAQSQRDSISQPRVASLRATLGQSPPATTTLLKGLHHESEPGHPQEDTTPLAFENDSHGGPRVARPTRNPGLANTIPSGLIASTADAQTERTSAMLAVVVKDADAVYPVRIDPTFSDANWSSMGGIAGADGEVDAAVMDGSGNLYIGGGFTVVGDVIANGIAKWNGSGWSALGSGIDGGVSALAVSGSDVYAGGWFTNAGGSPANYIAKWNGSSWSALGSGMDSAPPGYFPYVSALVVSGSDVYAGGLFTNAGGSPANSIAKWNGSSWLPLGSGMNGGVFALVVSGSDVYAGGTFTTAGGSAASNIAKWNGSGWSALGSGIDGGVSALAVSGSDVYAGGGTAATIAKWNGSSWTALGRMAGGMDGPSVCAVAVSGSNVYAGGWFATAGDSAAANIAKWDGSSWTAVGSGMAGGGWGNGPSVVCAVAVSGSNVYVGGLFSTAGGSPANSIAKWNGTSWSPLGSGIEGGVGVFALGVSGSDVYAGGSFTKAGGSAATNIAKWDGSSWLPLGSGLDGDVYALAAAGSNVYTGGSFTTAGGSAATNIAKWDGSSWSALGSGLDSAPPGYFPHVSALAVSGSNVYAGGEFMMAGGSAASGIARWDGSSWSPLGSGVSGTVSRVFALAVSGGDVYAGGDFETAGGTAANCIAKWNGNSWSALGSGVAGTDGYLAPVFALAVSGGDVYAGGEFAMAGGSTANYIAKWNGNSWSPLGSGMNRPVSALAVSGSDLYAGGLFTTVGGKASGCIARAYLLSLPALSVFRSGTDVMVTWPSADTAGFALE